MMGEVSTPHILCDGSGYSVLVASVNWKLTFSASPSIGYTCTSTTFEPPSPTSVHVAPERVTSVICRLAGLVNIVM